MPWQERAVLHVEPIARTLVPSRVVARVRIKALTRQGTSKASQAFMDMLDLVSVPYPPIEKLGLIGDRRTAALIAADGTLCWMSLPNYDGRLVFGHLLDASRGGYWKMGPASRRFGRQRYLGSGPILQTSWDEPAYSVELTDFMPWPEDNRAPDDERRRTVLRRLRCTRGTAPCRIALEARDNFQNTLKIAERAAHSAAFGAQRAYGVWVSRSTDCAGERLAGEFVLAAGEEVWCAFGPGEDKAGWTEAAAATALQTTIDYWKDWLSRIGYQGRRRGGVLRSAMLVHLLTFAPTGALVASPTTSLPERIGGEHNYDYRYSWIRDSSLGFDLLVKLGLTKDAHRFVEFLAGLESSSGNPLRVLYTIDGKAAPDVATVEAAGYRHSQPVRIGNAAIAMSEIDSYGYFADCLLAYLQHGGEWKPGHWTLVRRIADFTMRQWRQPGSSIWELKPERQFVASKIMSAVTLNRASRIAELVGHRADFVDAWLAAYKEILAEILSLGWNEQIGAFRQCYGGDKVDASSLLIALMKLLPPTDPRLQSAVRQLVAQLDLNGFLHRFSDFDESKSQVLGDHEGAFLICSFWLAQLFAMTGETAKAEDILQRAETIAGELGLFSEAVDARDGSFLGNMPLVFSQVEYARAAIALDEAYESQSRASFRKGAKSKQRAESE
jgi:GH15 family glucan-1,4-alpha-glucosidase